MSTRSATIIRQKTMYGEEEAYAEEIMRFYRHCDGYPEGHGIDLAESVELAGVTNRQSEAWVQSLLSALFWHEVTVEFEAFGSQHGDLEYLYVVEGTVNRMWSATKSDELPITISVYGIGWDEDYADAMKRDPIFSGTAREYIERFGR